MSTEPVGFVEQSTHMGEHLLHQSPVLALVPRSVKDDDTPASSEAVSGHLELVHRVDVLNVKLARGPVGRSRKPEVQVLVPSRLKVKGVVARVQVGELVDEVQGRFRVELGVW